MAWLVGASSRASKGCRFDSWSGLVWEATDWCFSHTSVSLFLSLFLLISLSRKQWKKCPQVREKTARHSREGILTPASLSPPWLRSLTHSHAVLSHAPPHWPQFNETFMNAPLSLFLPQRPEISKAKNQTSWRYTFLDKGFKFKYVTFPLPTSAQEPPYYMTALGKELTLSWCHSFSP